MINTCESRTKRRAKQIESLIRQCSDNSWLIRAKAAISLGRLGSPTAVHRLINTLSDKNYLVCYHAAEALKQIGTPEAVKAVNVWENSN